MGDLGEVQAARSCHRCDREPEREGLWRNRISDGPPGFPDACREARSAGQHRCAARCGLSHNGKESEEE